MGTRRIRVTVCNFLEFITGEVLASFLSAYGRVKKINLLRSTARTAYGDYTFRLCLTREVFQAIPETIISRERQKMVVVEGTRPRYWDCKQLGLIAKFCPPLQTSRTLQPPQSPQLLQPPSSVSSQPRRRKEKIRVRSSAKPTIIPKLRKAGQK